MNSLARVLLIGLVFSGVCGVAMPSESKVPIGELEVVLQTLSMEAGSEGVEGMAWVYLTLHQRTIKRNTSLSVEALRPYQYSCWNKDRRGVRSWSKAWLGSHYSIEQRSEAINGLKRGLILASNPSFQGIRHYHTEKVSPSWAVGKVPFRKVGSHLFYRGIK